jgi:hypothetical protein
MILNLSLAYTSHKILNHPVYFLFLLQQVVLNHQIVMKYILRK